MGTELDIDDVAATSPLAKRELEELRKDAARCKWIRDHFDKSGFDPIDRPGGTLAFDAMTFARLIHRDQRRKYTGNPYADHLAEVAGIAMSSGWHHPEIHPDRFMAVAWLHDSREDQGISHELLAERFGEDVARGVTLLSDLEPGNRAQRKAAARERLANAPGWVQTIKCADLISNTGSIVQNDPKFAIVYLAEARALLDALDRADSRLRSLARTLCAA